MSDRFTIVFEGDIRSFPGNPLKTETPFGVPYTVAVGDLVEQLNELQDSSTPAPETLDAPDGATHMRRPEYVTAWRFDGASEPPKWLVDKYLGNPLPDHRRGKYALATDGEFWRWDDTHLFERLFMPIPPSTAISDYGVPIDERCRECSDAPGGPFLDQEREIEDLQAKIVELKQQITDAANAGYVHGFDMGMRAAPPLPDTVREIDTRQPFARYPALAAEIERMAGTGNVGSMIDWDRFLSALNAALSSAPVAPAAPVAGAPQPSPETDAVKEIVELYFAPWGAAKGARWEALSGDQPFNAEVAMNLIEAALHRNNEQAGGARA